MPVLTPDQRAAMRAAAQHGLLTAADARAAGLSVAQTKQRVSSGRWERLARGLYVVAGTPPSWRRNALAGCLLGGGDAVASHHTALALHGLGQPSLLPHISVPPSASGRTPLARVHRTVVPSVDRSRVDGVPCTSVARTVVDVAGMIERSALEDVVDSAFAERRAAPEWVVAALGRARGGPLGAPALREAIQVWHGDIEPESPAEARFLRLLRTYGCSDAVPQYVVRDMDGIFVARLDVAVPARRVGYEYDSVRYHNPRRYDADEARDARLAALGWTTHRVSKRDLLPGDTRIRDLVRGAEAA